MKASELIKELQKRIDESQTDPTVFCYIGESWLEIDHLDFGVLEEEGISHSACFLDNEESAS